MKIPDLPKSCKNMYRFRLGTTSFIYPADYITNVRRTGPYLDEIELLMFESRRPDSLPSAALVREMRAAADALDLCYNVHLPTDISLTNPDQQDAAAKTLAAFIERTRPLNPTAYALHLPYEPPPDDPASLKGWRRSVAVGIRRLLDCGIAPRKIAVETLEDYPLAWITDIIQAFDLSICLDMGHWFLNDVDPEPFFDEFYDRIPLIHLHGARDNRDHLALSELSGRWAKTTANILNRFTGTVSLEVFSFEKLSASLIFLEDIIFTLSHSDH